jgi:hypothetical protein
VPIYKEQVSSKQSVVLGGIEILRTYHVVRKHDVARVVQVCFDGAKRNLLKHNWAKAGTAGKSGFEGDLFL